MQLRKAFSALSFGLTLAAFGPSMVACGSSSSGTGSTPTGATAVDSGTGDPGDFVDGSDPNASYTPDQLWANDPPPPWCGPKNGTPAPAPPGGTPECPDDKNREGCACPEVGKTAACWPGLRVNRGLGQCKDGTTTCESKGELDKAWGACKGFVLPTKGETKGKAACKCFSAGSWKIDNVVPCFVQSNSDYYATSAECSGSTPPPATVPSTPWTKDTITVDCAGHFKLCFSIKQGDAKNPTANDCSLMTVCTEGDYLQANKPQVFPELGGWESNDSACVAKIYGGAPIYGEMTVKGKSVICDEISDNGDPIVFNRVQYCPIGCSAGSTDPKCAGCQATGSGSF